MIIRGYHRDRGGAIGDALSIARGETGRSIGQRDGRVTNNGDDVDFSGQGLLGHPTRSAEDFDLREWSMFQAFNQDDVTT